jgi:hypothetical protein
MYGIVTDKDNFVMDNMKDPSGESRKGTLLFKKKSDAAAECDYLNSIRHRMKISECYTVSKFTEENLTDYGIILDGKWQRNVKCTITFDQLVA